MKFPRKLLFISIIGSVVFSNLTSCSNQPNVHLNMMSLGEMPAMVQSAPRAVQEAYQFAAVNPEVIQNIPCYCGCNKIGHKSNYECYVSGVDDTGEISFDNHAIGCSICVEITQDAMKLLKEGRTVPEIKTYIDITYSKYGEPTAP